MNKQVALTSVELNAETAALLDKAAIERGDVGPHEEVMAKLERMRAKFEARCREESGRAPPAVTSTPSKSI